MTLTRATGPVAVLGTVRAMGSDVVVHGRPRGRAGEAVVARALDVFTDVHRTCTRFDPDSPLMRVNARPDAWHPVPPVLFDAVRAARTAYVTSGGRFDPRVLEDLVRLGYDRSLPSGSVAPTAPAHDAAPRPGAVRGPWHPRFRPGPRPEVHLGGTPIDLGGIGKGLAVRWASAVLAEALDDFLVDAGGDCDCVGTGPEADGWRVGVEDPVGGDRPLAVLALRDRACATSSTRLRRWRSGDRTVHHLIDPASGRPGGDGLLAVTVVADDPADAEVTTKSLFLAGASAVADEADRLGAAALWVTEDGTAASSAALDPYVVWRA